MKSTIEEALGLDRMKAVEKNAKANLDETGELTKRYAVEKRDDTLASKYPDKEIVISKETIEADGKLGAPVADEMEHRLWKQAKAFYDLPHTIIDPDRETRANCHGHTRYPGRLAWVNGEDLEAAYLDGDLTANYAFFYLHGTLVHSGIVEGTKLIHRLIHVGLVVSQIGDSRCGYQVRFNLPAEDAGLREFVLQRDGAGDALKPAKRASGVMFDGLKDAIKALEKHAAKSGATLSDLCQVEPGLADGKPLLDATGKVMNALYDDDASSVGELPGLKVRYEAFKAALGRIEGGADIAGFLGDPDAVDDEDDGGQHSSEDDSH